MQVSDEELIHPWIHFSYPQRLESLVGIDDGNHNMTLEEVMMAVE
jgi:hypothetical protein